MYLTPPMQNYEDASRALKAKGWIWDPNQSGYYIRDGQRAIIRTIRTGPNGGRLHARLVRDPR